MEIYVKKHLLHSLDVHPIVTPTYKAMYPRLFDTLILIRCAHQGQLYSDAIPYWHHPVRVTLRTRAIWTPTMMYAGLLHDTIEDTPLEAEDLYAHGYSPEVVSLVSLLTKTYKEYDDYIESICRSGRIDALLLKYADSTENTNNIHGKPNPFKVKQMQKHGKALPLITNALVRLGAEEAMDKVFVGALKGPDFPELIAWTGTDMEIP